MPVLDTTSQVIGAIGALGVASAALVDASKALPGGGPSRFGLVFVRRLIATCLPSVRASDEDGATMRAGHQIVFDELEAHWINGMALSSQKSAACSLIKLYMQPEAAATVARRLGVREEQFAAVARLWRDGPAGPNVDPPVAVVGRIDLALTALVDSTYQRADQRYRNVCKLLSGLVAVAISAFAGVLVWGPNDPTRLLLTLLGGVLAVPLAPIAKDLTSALQAGVKVAQSLRK